MLIAEYIQNYYKSVCDAYRLGNIESSYNTPIITLLTQFGCIARDMSGERSGQTGENIDIKLWRGDDDATETEPFAGVEVKKVEGIDIRARKQIKSEADRYGNAILTDNLQWQFWHSNEDRMYSGVQLIERDHSERGNGKLILREDNIELFVSLVEDFLLRDPAQIRSSNKLAEYMAMHARTIRSVITGVLKDDGNGDPLINDRQKSLPMFPELYGLYSRIKGDLRPAMSTRDFADMYAQTIVYGLFIARYNDTTPDDFDRFEAIKYLQEESELLKQFFMHIAGSGKKHPTLEAVIDKLCSLYRICNIADLLGGDEHQDTIIHFYEAFLTYYDPALRKSLGVFYTPVQAVRYLVSSVDRILVEDFGIEGGLSNNDQLTITVPSESYQISKTKFSNKKEITAPRVAILDPACGTGSFGAEIIKYIRKKYFSGAREAFYRSYIQNENGLLSRLIGFEIMMTSYVVAHLKIRRTINETLGHAPEVQFPVNIFLTNTLAPPHSSLERDEQMTMFDFSAAITDEAYHADTWKTRRPIKVIIGNPPYLAASTNSYDISAYKTETDGISKLQEKNSKMLGDDYVKFFRFSQEIIDKNGEGILAFVSSHGYIDNPTFRGMRASLLRTFDKIIVVNLHGNSNIGEIAPDGGVDENIFDIKQGVALFVGIKTSKNSEWAKVMYTDLWGKRNSKFRQLQNGVLEYVEVKPNRKMAYFAPIESDDNDIYEKCVSVAELFPVRATGVNSGNDKIALAPTKKELIRRIEIVKNSIDGKSIIELFGKFTGGQTMEKIRDDVLSNDGTVTPISYRPFDERWTFYTGNSSGWLDRPREKNTMNHFLKDLISPIGKNIGLVFGKSAPISNVFAMVFSSTAIIEKGVLDIVDRAYFAPLYLHSEIDDAWTPNFAPDALARLTENVSFKLEPIEVFDYIYGVLYDPVYRERYNEFLKRDFPRVPVINREADRDNPNAFFVSEDMFHKYVAAGECLRKLHLMQVKTPAELSIDPNDSDDMEICSIKYKDGVLRLNAKKSVFGISNDVWNYRIGGYQVLDKWFKSHKGETFTIESFEHISNVVGLLAETIEVQESLRRMHDGTDAGQIVNP